MYSLTASFPSGKIEFLGFVNSEKEAEDVIDGLCRKYGAEALGSTGVQFNIELAI